MTTGYQVGGVDIDSLFEPYHTGVKAANTGYQVGGTDIANRYQAVAAGNGTAYGTTNIKTGGTDIGSLFVKLGTYSAGMTATVNQTTCAAFASGKGTFNLTPAIVITPSGGSGSYTYLAATQVTAGTIYGFSCVQTGNSYQFRAANPLNEPPTPDSSTWQIGVSDGTTTQYFTITASFN